MLEVVGFLVDYVQELIPRRLVPIGRFQKQRGAVALDGREGVRISWDRVERSSDFRRFAS